MTSRPAKSLSETFSPAVQNALAQLSADDYKTRETALLNREATTALTRRKAAPPTPGSAIGAPPVAATTKLSPGLRSVTV